MAAAVRGGFVPHTIELNLGNLQEREEYEGGCDTITANKHYSQNTCVNINMWYELQVCLHSYNYVVRSHRLSHRLSLSLITS